MSLTNDLVLNTNVYKYRIDMTYVKPKTGEFTHIDSFNIKSLIIDHDYIGANMPMIFVNMSLDSRLIEDMYVNSGDNLINLTISKFNDSSDIELDEVYLQEQFIYFINDEAANRDLNRIYQGDNSNREDMFRDLQIGLLQLDLVNKNKNTTSTVITNTTMTNAVHTVTSHMNIVLEPLLYDTMIDQLVIPPMDSVAKIIKYLYDNRVFYNTPYRYFVDNDCTYIMSSSGVALKRKGEKYNNILIDVDTNTQAVNEDMIGMSELPGYYYIYTSYMDTKMMRDNVTDKRFNQISAISTEGDITESEMKKINRSSYGEKKNQSVRVRQDNPNAYKAIQSSAEHTAVRIQINKNDMDTSIITPNKQFIITFGENNDYSGIYILNKKRDLFFKEGTSVFMINTSMDLSKVDPYKYAEATPDDAKEYSKVIESANRTLDELMNSI